MDTVLIDLEYGVTLEAPTGDLITERLRNGDGTFYEEPLQDRIEYLLPEGGVFVDGGAHIGVHSVGIAARRPDVQVAAFEPNPEIDRILHDNIVRNGVADQVERYPIALFSTSELGWIKPDDRPDNTGGARWEAGVPGSSYGSPNMPDPPDWDGTVVRGDPLDRWSIEPDVIKLDLEGGEVAALMGAREKIREYAPEILVECATDEALYYVRDVIGPLGYELAAKDPVVAKTPVYHFTDMNGAPESV